MNKLTGVLYQGNDREDFRRAVDSLPRKERCCFTVPGVGEPLNIKVKHIDAALWKGRCPGIDHRHEFMVYVCPRKGEIRITIRAL